MATSLALNLKAELPAEFVKPIVGVRFAFEDVHIWRQFGDRERSTLERLIACTFADELANYFYFLDFVLAEEHGAETANTTGPQSGQDRNEEDEGAADNRVFRDEIEVIANAEGCSRFATGHGDAHRLRIELVSQKAYAGKADLDYFFRVVLERGTRRLRKASHKELSVKLRFESAYGRVFGDARTLFTQIKSQVVLDQAVQEPYFKGLGPILSRIPLTGARVKILRKPEPAKLAWVVGAYDCDLCLDFTSEFELEHKTFAGGEGRREVKATYELRHTDTEDQSWKGMMELHDPGANINSRESIGMIRELPPMAEVMNIYVTDYQRSDHCTNEYQVERRQPKRPEEVSFDDDEEDESPVAACADRP